MFVQSIVFQHANSNILYFFKNGWKSLETVNSRDNDTMIVRNKQSIIKK